MAIRGLFYWNGLTWIPAWISNHMPGKVWCEATYPFSKNHLSHTLLLLNYLSMLGLKLMRLSKRWPWKVKKKQKVAMINYSSDSFRTHYNCWNQMMSKIKQNIRYIEKSLKQIFYKVKKIILYFHLCELNGVKCINTLRPRQSDRQFPDYIFKCIFMRHLASMS